MADLNSTYRSDYSDDFENVSMLTGDEDNDNTIINNSNSNNDNDNNNNDDIYDNDNFESDGDSIILVGRPIEHSIQINDINDNDNTKFVENTNYNKRMLSIDTSSDNKTTKPLKPKLATSPERNNDKDININKTNNIIIDKRVAFSSDTNMNKINTNANNKYKRNIKKEIKDKKDKIKVIDEEKSKPMKHISLSSNDIFDTKFKLQIGSYPDTSEPETVDTPRSYYGISSSPINKLKVNITNDDTSIHPQHVLKKQLDTALKKIQVLTKERAALIEKLDADNLGHELDKMRDVIAQQDRLIKKLKSDNYGLSLVTRNQARLLSKEDTQEESNPDSSEAHVKILLERTRRLGNHLTTSKMKEKKAIDDCEGFKKLYTKYRSQAESHAKVIADLTSKLEQFTISETGNDAKNKRSDYPLKSRKFLDNNYNNPNNPVLDSMDSNDNNYEPEPSKGNYIAAGSKDQGKNSRTQKSSDDNYVIEKLQKAIRVQRVSFTNEMNNFKSQITALKNDNSKLREELDEREKEARMHVIQIRQLRKKYDDLAEGNKRLKMASNVYSSMEEKIQIPVPNPKPPSVPSTSRNNSFRKSNANPNHQRAPPIYSDDMPKNKLQVQQYTGYDEAYDDMEEDDYVSNMLTEQYSDEFTEYLPDDASAPTFFITSHTN